MLTSQRAPRPASDAPADVVEPVSGLSELARRYDLILCDVWGVLHDGVRGFGSAGDALTRFREGGGCVVLVSNAPRPGPVVAAQLDELGIPRDAYDRVVTSGDLTRAVVAARGAEIVHHIGPARDLKLFEGLEARFGTVETAGYVVCTGLFDDETETAADYEAALRTMRERNLWMVCANPDIVVERGDRLIPCAGAIAAAYEDIGGRTYTGGKPHPPIYEAALAQGADALGRTPDPARVLAIGDAIRTDVAGGRGFGLDVLMIARGIHAGELGVGVSFDAAAAIAWLGGQAVRPTSIAEDLRW
jgi:HAD superfamily hydrolase (TIGR01459 family)